MDVLNVCTDIRRGPCGNWKKWSELRAQELRNWKGAGRLLGIGYSLGGRLLLSIADEDLQLFDQIVLLSVNPGFLSVQEKKDRRAKDENWAYKFEVEDWEKLMSEWNSQPVFKDSTFESPRSEKDFDRKRLAQVMREFSTSLQKDYRVMAVGGPMKQLWLAGENDSKFVSFLGEMNDSPFLECRVISSVGHRLHLEGPQKLAQMLTPYVIPLL